MFATLNQNRALEPLNKEQYDYKGVFAPSTQNKEISTFCSEIKNSKFETSSSLLHRVQPYLELAELSNKTKKVSALIETITNYAGSQEPDSEGLAYLLDKVIQYFSKPILENRVLEKLKEQTLEDKEMLQHLLKHEDVSDKSKASVLRALDNHNKMLQEMQQFNRIKIIEKGFKGLAAIFGIKALRNYFFGDEAGFHVLLSATYYLYGCFFRATSNKYFNNF